MGATLDPRSTLSDLHHQATGEVLGLVEGLYSNIEDGLFELADRATEQQRRERCFNLMRELRYRRGFLVKHFTKTMYSLRGYWFTDEIWNPDMSDLGGEFNQHLTQVTAKSTAHFTGLLRLISERAQHASPRHGIEPAGLPIGPQAISNSFVQSCRLLRMDAESIELVLSLFSRFVLERLGHVYARSNDRLRDAGFCTLDELELAQSASTA